MQLLAEALRTTLPLLLAGQPPIPNPGLLVERPGACEIALSPEPRFVAGREERSTDILHRVAGGVILPTGNVVIANAGDFELRWHNPRGRLVRTTGLFQDSLMLAHDVSASRIAFFTLEGDHRRTVPLPLGAGVRWPAVAGIAGFPGRR